MILILGVWAFVRAGPGWGPPVVAGAQAARSAKAASASPRNVRGTVRIMPADSIRRDLSWLETPFRRTTTEVIR